MNKKLRFTGGEPNITEDNLFRDSDALYNYAIALAKSISGDQPTILQGCTFTKNGTTDASITAGYVYYNGEVVRVEEQLNVANTLLSNLYELQKDVDYDADGDKTFVDGQLRRTYQVNRMILTNVVAVTDFDIENIAGFGVYRTISNSDITVESGNGSINTSFTFLKYTVLSKTATFNGVVSFTVDGSIPDPLDRAVLTFSFPDSYFVLNPVDSSVNQKTPFTSSTEETLANEAIVLNSSIQKLTGKTQFRFFFGVGKMTEGINYTIPINITFEVE